MQKPAEGEGGSDSPADAATPPVATTPEPPVTPSGPEAHTQEVPSDVPPPAWSSRRPPPDRLRTNVKVSAVVMILFGLLLVWQAYNGYLQVTHVVTDDGIRGIADAPGGNFTLQFTGASAEQPAVVRLRDFNGTLLANSTIHSGDPVQVDAPNLAIRLEVEWNNSTWTRKVLAPERYQPSVLLDGEAPRMDEAWVRPDLSHLVPLVWTLFGLGVLLVVSGAFAFRLRAQKVALAGAYAFMAAGLALTLMVASAGAGFAQTLQPLLFAAMGAFCVWSFTKGKDRFQVVQAGPLRL